MREILFRARRRKMVWLTMYTEYKYEPGEMVYGSLLDLGGDNIYIVMPNDYEEDREYKDAHKEAEYIPVYRETVGQYTGLKDKNGKEIFEGDVVKHNWGFGNGSGYVYYSSPHFGLHKLTGNGVCTEFEWNDFQEFEVIGNIYEHPHLLEGRDEA